MTEKTEEIDWDQDAVDDFVRKMKEEREETGGDPEPPSEAPSLGVIWVGVVLLAFTIYGGYYQLHTFMLYTAALFVVLALGNKAIR